MTFAVRVENVSKQYRIGPAGERRTYRTLGEELSGLASRTLSLVRAGSWSRKTEECWALKGVSLDVQRGAALGIIGRNGAGKSTLLKIISRITRPTAGKVRLRGRVASLLEVGTGFHPELTGRENMFLSGAVLGLRRSEIRHRFDEMVAFAEVERFLSTPVKRYSSGMYMRLAFAIAAHLEPEILLVDEVLAVGDAHFQKKCLGKMGEVARAGRTVLFVSHNMGVIERLCSHAVLLEEGRVAATGPPDEVIAKYLAGANQPAIEWHRTTPYPDAPHYRRVRLCHPDGSPCVQPASGAQFGVEVEFALSRPVPGLVLAVAVADALGDWLFSTSPVDNATGVPETRGTYRTRMLFPAGLFLPKQFALTFALYDRYRNYDYLPGALCFCVAETASLTNLLPGGRVGDLQIVCDWSEFQHVE
ncbi:MAG TPA: polysaccharide ABC transporter ATP-binding protein [Gemmataceae bacterium]|jgi:lipopolysaccharide transport system ATP-binding protein|nr:polysaccharide ABC transporter ATP-binding protein [Gemmataceae bacterium]